jgi:trans-aconitate methyltransferase
LFEKIIGGWTMNSRWKEIWEKKSLDIIAKDESILSNLLKLDGFDSGFNTLNEEIWIEYTSYITDILKIKKEFSIFEVGCGSGAFLYPFYCNHHNVAGIDYSRALIEASKYYMPKGSFSVDEAINLSINEKFDTVLSNGVFLYFPNYEYSKIVLTKMVEKARYSVAILEVSDLDTKEEALSMRKSLMSEEEYRKRYDGLDHLYYSQTWFTELAEELNCDIEIRKQNIRNYPNNLFRFNVFMNKR